jgi:superfamily II DNA or RNA helicase
MIDLRLYQEKLIDSVRDKFKRGKKRVILCAPTGAGKTVMFSSIVIRTISKGLFARSLIVTDRIELLKQTWVALDNIGAQPVVYDASSKTKVDYSHHKVVVAMIETVKRRAKSGKLLLGDFDVIIIDEAHKGNFKELFEIYPDSFYVGATATPIASQKRNPLKNYWHDIAVEVDTPDLVDLNFLVPCRPFAMQSIDLDNLVLDKKTGDYTDQSLFAEFDKRTVYEGLMQAISDMALDKKTIIFCVNIQHTENTYNELINFGYTASFVTSHSSKDERAEMMRKFHSGESQFMVNCGILTTGYDHPPIQCVIMNRATKSLPLFLQCCGRGSRIYQEKNDFTLIDMGENVKTHGFWDDKRDWIDWFNNPPKQGAEKPPPSKDCPKCRAIIHVRIMKCPECGYVFPQKEKEFSMGELVELKKAPIALIGRKIDTLNPFELSILSKSKRYNIGLCYRVARSKSKLYLSEYARWMGYAPGWVYYQSSQDSKFSNLIIT